MTADINTLINAASSACKIWISVDEDGLWVNGQRPHGALTRGLGKNLDIARLARALPGVIASAPRCDNSSPIPTAPIWEAIRRAYNAAK